MVKWDVLAPLSLVLLSGVSAQFGGAGGGTTRPGFPPVPPLPGVSVHVDAVQVLTSLRGSIDSQFIRPLDERTNTTCVAFFRVTLKNDSNEPVYILPKDLRLNSQGGYGSGGGNELFRIHHFQFASVRLSRGMFEQPPPGTKWSSNPVKSGCSVVPALRAYDEIPSGGTQSVVWASYLTGPMPNLPTDFSLWGLTFATLNEQAASDFLSPHTGPTDWRSRWSNRYGIGIRIDKLGRLPEARIPEGVNQVVDLSEIPVIETSNMN